MIWRTWLVIIWGSLMWKASKPQASSGWSVVLPKGVSETLPSCSVRASISCQSSVSLLAYFQPPEQLHSTFPVFPSIPCWIFCIPYCHRQRVIPKCSLWYEETRKSFLTFSFKNVSIYHLFAKVVLLRKFTFHTRLGNEGTVQTFSYYIYAPIVFFQWKKIWPKQFRLKLLFRKKSVLHGKPANIQVASKWGESGQNRGMRTGS